MNKNSYTQYIQSKNIDGSNKAPSYIKALEWLCKMLEVEPFTFGDCKNIWAVNSVDRLQELYDFVQLQKRKGDSSVWIIENIPKSYLRDGFCSAALKSYQEFLIENGCEQKILAEFDNYKGTEDGLPGLLEDKLSSLDVKNIDLNGMRGYDEIRAVRVRLNQNVFRKIVLKIYNQSCCITGLNIPDINRASHIIPWATDKSKRLDPRNGLCLSATYDAAFDRNLISLDDDYRIILSKNLSDYYTNESVKSYFVDKEGTKIALPNSYFPKKAYLETHRKNGDF